MPDATTSPRDRPFDRLRARLRFVFTFVSIQITNVIMTTSFFLTYWLLKERNYKIFGVRAMSWYLIAGGVRVKTVGTEKLKLERPAIYVSNHLSHFDIPASMVALPVRFHFIAKRELLHIPFFGWSLPYLGMIMIDRSTTEKAYQSIREAGRRIREQNESVLIYPEGGISKAGRLSSFKKGTFTLAIEAGVPIVPLFIRGSADLFSVARVESRPGQMEIEVLDEIGTVGYTEETRDELMNKVHEAMKRAEEEGG